MTFHFGVVTIMPEVVEAICHGMVKKAIGLKKIQLDCWNPRDWAEPPYYAVDDTPYGGGPGMVMKYEPMANAIRFAKSCMPPETPTIYLSPQGKKMTQVDLNCFATNNTSVLFVTGRYEGIDERLVHQYIDEEWSLGDFVISGGELAAMTFIDALTRLLPGVLGHPESNQAESFMQPYLDHPHYTRPECIDDLCVPAVLLSGHHADISRWRKKQALGRTLLKRPDLLENITLTTLEKKLLAEFKLENGEQGCSPPVED